MSSVFGCTSVFVQSSTGILPCVPVVAGAACVLLLATWSVVAYIRSSKFLRDPNDCEYGSLSPRRILSKANHALYISMVLVVLASGVIITIQSIAEFGLLGAPFIAYGSSQILGCTLLLAAESHAAKKGQVFSAKFVAWTNTCLAAFMVYIGIQLVAHAHAAPEVTLQVVVTSLISFSGGFLGSVGLAVVEGYRTLTHDVHVAGISHTLIPSSDPDEETTKDGKPKNRNWFRQLYIVIGVVWPRTNSLQLRVFVSLVVVLLGRAVNLATPIVYKNMIDRISNLNLWQLEHKEAFKKVYLPWMASYLVLAILQGSSGGTGFVQVAQSYLWIPVEQEGFRVIANDVFRHVLNLDLTFHLSRRTGEVTRQIDRGVGAIENLLRTVIFSLGPQLLDVCLNLTYLGIAVSPLVTLFMIISFLLYIPLTVLISERRSRQRKEMNERDNELSTICVDALLNYETVKYFTNEPLEESNYAHAIQQYLKAEFRAAASLCLLNFLQGLIIFMGLAGGLSVVAWRVAQGDLQAGDVVLVITMVARCYSPLTFLGTYYRMLQKASIDLDNLFDLLSRRPDVVDPPANISQALVLKEGSLAFEHVWFAYKEQQVLKDLTFAVPGGSTVALVGPTGSGKSTVLRLLLRFYDPASGSVLIDGQDLRHVPQREIRRVMGMVPQDAVLFNKDIRYNIRYGRPDCTDQEVYDAADAAAIREAIEQRFPKGYETVVGERGLRLSGGEKQRVAFARALLKNAPILLLDEATSSLDSLTEQRIQRALLRARSHRTTVIVAHRLSTVRDADVIIVLQEGSVLEKGSHQELLDQGGLYAGMWHKQAEMGNSATIDELGG